jgi:hypothetical protein
MNFAASHARSCVQGRVRGPGPPRSVQALKGVFLLLLQWLRIALQYVQSIHSLSIESA